MTVFDIIEGRVTTKMLGNPEQPLPPRASLKSQIDQAISSAGWAPFHRPAHTSHRQGNGASIIEPWRFYVLDAASCRMLLQMLGTWPERAGKILNMLAAADALIQVTWLPDPSDDDQGFAPTEENMEHIAAAGAAIQNFLIAATALGLKTYWSSGGVLRSAKAFDALGIPTNQILLGSIFIFPDQPATPVEVLSGKLREGRSDPAEWAKWLTVPEA